MLFAMLPTFLSLICTNMGIVTSLSMHDLQPQCCDVWQDVWLSISILQVDERTLAKQNKTVTDIHLHECTSQIANDIRLVCTPPADAAPWSDNACS